MGIWENFYMRNEVNVLFGNNINDLCLETFVFIIFNLVSFNLLLFTE